MVFYHCWRRRCTTLEDSTLSNISLKMPERHLKRHSPFAVIWPNPNRAEHLAGLANTLDSLGTLYSILHRSADARLACEESLSIGRRLVLVDPETFLPMGAHLLNGLGNLYSAQHQADPARAALARLSGFTAS